MILATQELESSIVSELTDLSSPGGFTMSVDSVTAASMPSRLNIETHEITLMGPPGPESVADDAQLSVDPTVWFLLALG